jgi:hypothetical protein
MTLSDLAAIAEIVSAIAVVITLIYLATQVKHGKESLDANTKAIRGQVISDVTKNVQDHVSMIIQGHNVAEVIKKMGSDEGLEPDDALVLDMTLTAIFVARQNEYFQWRQGLLDESVFQSLHHISLTILGTTSGKHWWQNEGRNLVAPEFVKFTDRLIEQGPNNSLDSWRRATQLDE